MSAHYLHILDATGTANAHHLTVDDRTDAASSMVEIVDAWRAIADVTNAVAASLGSAPIDPFVLSDTVVDELTFVRDRIADHTARVRFDAAPM